MPIVKQSNVDFVLLHSMGDPMLILGDSPSNQQLCPTITTNVPSREELDEILKCFPYFTGMESPVSDMNDFFSCYIEGSS